MTERKIYSVGRLKTIYKETFFPTDPKKIAKRNITFKEICSLIQMHTSTISAYDNRLRTMGELRKLYPYLPNLQDASIRKFTFKQIYEHPGVLQKYCPKGINKRRGYGPDIRQCYLEGVSQSEIARKLQISRSAVRQSLISQGILKS